MNGFDMNKLLFGRKVQTSDGKEGLVHRADDRYVFVFFSLSQEIDAYVLDAISRESPTLRLSPPLTRSELAFVRDLASRKLELDGAEIRREKAVAEERQRKFSSMCWGHEQEYEQQMMRRYDLLEIQAHEDDDPIF